MTDQAYDEAMMAMIAAQQDQDAINAAALEEVRLLIDYPFEQLVESLKEVRRWAHSGFATVQKVDHTNCFYPGAEYYKTNGAERSPHYFRKQEEHGIGHCLIWQTTGACEDDYSGYQLFPLKDGRYWMIYYEC